MTQPDRPRILKKSDADVDELDFVRTLQRILARTRLPPPIYNTTKQTEQDSGFFVTTLIVSGNVFVGKGITETDAENNAAELAYIALKSTGELKSALAQKNLENRRPSDSSAWHDIPTAMNPQKAVFAPWPVPVPRLAHGLSRVLSADNSVATPVESDVKGRRFSPYLRRIVQPEHINWEAIPPFTPASQDSVLHELTVTHGARYKASTSSITGLLSHVYQV